jgi:peroxiredoxin
VTRPQRNIWIRRGIAGAIVLGVWVLLAVQFVSLVGPAAAREVEAAGRGMRPSPDNPKLGKLPGAVAPNFALKDHTGATVRLSDFKGKVVLVNFWASWCGVCKSEKPGLIQMADEMQSDDFLVVTLASDSSWPPIKEALPHGAPFRVLLDPPAEGENLGQVALQYGITAVPESFLIDRQGKVRYYFINRRDWQSGVAKTLIQSVIDE